MIKVWLISFSYRAGPPDESSADGIGSVFDCRHLISPRGTALETLRSKEATVAYLALPEIAKFYQAVKAIVSQRVAAYLPVEDTEVWFHFGCMAGEVRSVFFAEAMKAEIEATFGDDVEVYTFHREQEKRGR